MSASCLQSWEFRASDTGYTRVTDRRSRWLVLSPLRSNSELYCTALNLIDTLRKSATVNSSVTLALFSSKTNMVRNHFLFKWHPISFRSPKAPANKELERKVCDCDGWHQACHNNATDPRAQAISSGEVISAQGRMKLATAPRYDLVHPEFLKHLGPKALTYQNDMASYRESQKPGKDRHHAASYRSISLVSVCYKLLESTILQRICPIMEDLVSVDQAGFHHGHRTCYQVTAVTSHYIHWEWVWEDRHWRPAQYSCTWPLHTPSCTQAFFTNCPTACLSGATKLPFPGPHRRWFQLEVNGLPPLNSSMRLTSGCLHRTQVSWLSALNRCCKSFSTS